VFATHIVNFPKSLIIPPIPFVMMNVPAFFKARVNAAMADVQKFSEDKATWQ